MIALGVLLTVVSGVCNGLFTAPMKMIRGWKWEHIWLVFIVVACLILPVALVAAAGFGRASDTLRSAPRAAVWIALIFGFAWGFGAILFGRSVDRLGVSLANTLVIGLSSALGSLVPLFFIPRVQFDLKLGILLFGVVAFLIGVTLCGAAGRLRGGEASARGRALVVGYAFSIGAGIMSAVFNIGYTLALPVSDAGVVLGMSRFSATNVLWLLMLGAGSIPNICYCSWLIARGSTARDFGMPRAGRAWALSTTMGVLWGASIFVYGAATPKLGDFGPSIGWPLSLAVALLVANSMGVLLGEWRAAPRASARLMAGGLTVLVAAIALCSWSAAITQR